MGSEGKTSETTSSSDPDSVMLNPDYLSRIREKDAGSCVDRPLTEEELAAFGKQKKKEKPGLKIRPTFSIKEVIDKDGKRRHVPFIGIQGTF